MSQLTSGEYDAVLNGVRLHYTIRGRQGGPALIVAIAVEDSAAMKAGCSCQTRSKEKGLVRPLQSCYDLRQRLCTHHAEF